MATIPGDLRLALRALRRAPAFALTTILILALAIGVSTVMFTVCKTVLLDRLPVAAQDRVAIMHPLDSKGTHLDAPFAYLPEIGRDSGVFQGVAGVYHLGTQPAPLLNGDVSVELGLVNATANFFNVLGMRPVVGRFFRPEDGAAGAPPVIVLSNVAWRRSFGGDPGVIGRSLTMPYTRQRAQIVGVAPAGFEYPAGVAAWLPIPPDFTGQVDIIARLATGVTMESARSRLFALTQRVNPFTSTRPGQNVSPQTFVVAGVAAESFAETVLGSSRPVLIALTLAVGLLLLIACFNIGNLMLVRLLGRTRDIVVRRALGATAGNVGRLFVVENAVLGAIGGALGLLAALVLLRVIRAAAPPGLPRSDALGAMSTPLALAATVTGLGMVLFGVLPSVIASRINSYAALRSDSRTGMESRFRRRARRWLVATQIALAVVMLTGAGLLVRTLAHLEFMDLGYQPDHLWVLSFTAPQSVLPDDPRIHEVAKALVARLEATPDVVAVTPIEQMPFQGQSFYIMKLTRADQPSTQRENVPFVPFEFVGPDYFRTLRIPIVQGRGFTTADTRSSGRVVVINETLARQLWPGESPIGKQLVNEQPAMRSDTWTVAGVARDTRFRELKAVGPVVYFDWDQIDPFWNGLLVVRTTRPPAAMLPALRAATREVNPDLLIWRTQTMDQLLEAPLARPRMSALLMTGVSAVSLLLSVIGLYGVLSSSVRQQARDIGVRMALGATARNVRRLVLGDALRVLGAGALAGVLGAVIGGHVLASQLFDVRPIDPLSLAAAAALLLVAGLAAAWLPVRRASRISPVETLRME